MLTTNLFTAKSVALGTNLDLVDLPGLGDASSAREDVTTKYLSSLNHLVRYSHLRLKLDGHNK